MLAFLCKKLPSASWVLRDSETPLQFLRCNASLVGRFPFSSETAPVEKVEYFTLSYLQNSCGLSPEKAASVSQKVSLQNPDGPDSVIDLLRDYGLTKTHIARVVSARPKILLADPQKTLRPKLECLASIGVSKDDMGRVISMNPHIVNCSLKNQILPRIEFFRSVVRLSDAEIVRTFKRAQRLFHGQNQIEPNFAFLRELNMPQSSITLLTTCYPSLIFLSCEKFRRAVKEVIRMGYDPSRTKFINALAMISAMSKSTLQRKLEVYRMWGWSDEEIQCVIKNNPICTTISEKKIMGVMDFLVNKIGWESAEIARCAWIINFSLEKRIIPRCSVIAVLLSKGLEKKPSLIRILCMNESCFLNKFVAKYRDEIPYLSSIYEGKTHLQQVGCKSILKSGNYTLSTSVN